MIGDNAINIISENTLRFNVQLRALINFNEEPLKPGEEPLMNPDLAYTKFEYRLRYKPSMNNALKDKPYLLTGDIFYKRNNHIRFRDFDEFLEKKNEIKELKWLVKYSKIDKEMFDQAKQSLSLPLPVSFDVSKYSKEIRKKYKEVTGKNMTCSVFIDPMLYDAELERQKEFENFGKGKNRVKVGD